MNLPATVDLGRLEAEMVSMEQAPCPVVHRFGPGIYIREVTLKAGTIAIGHKQRFEHTNIMLTGKVALLDEFGATTVLQAPLFFVGKPGRKIGYIMEDTVWQNIYATTETDVEKLEEMFIDKSQAWIANNKEMRAIATAANEWVRNDFMLVIKEAGFTPEEVYAQSCRTDDLAPASSNNGSIVVVRESQIHGKGVFVTMALQSGQIIGPAYISGKRTNIGRYTNHHPDPNAVFVLNGNDIWAVARKPFSGCKGGSAGEEMTVDYRQVLALRGLWPPKQGELQ